MQSSAKRNMQTGHEELNTAIWWNYEPEPYIVNRKDGSVVISRDTNRNNKIRNIAHKKKFVNPETVKRERVDSQPHLPEQSVQPEQDRPAEPRPCSTSSR